MQWPEIAFAFMLCGGDLSRVIPRFLIDLSKRLAKKLSRSWIRYAWVAGLRACIARCLDLLL